MALSREQLAMRVARELQDGYYVNLGIGIPNILQPAFLPNYLSNLKAWYRFNIGITITGLGVSNWADQSGNGNNLRQTSDTNRPLKESDGSILFDGVDNFLDTNSFTLNQPTIVYFLGKQVSWTANDRILDGNVINTMGLRQRTTTPNIEMKAANNAPGNNDFVLDTYAVITAIYNGSLSVLRVNYGAEATGDAGSNNAGGFTLGARGGTPNSFSNIQVKEVLLYNQLQDAAKSNKIIHYLDQVGGGVI